MSHQHISINQPGEVSLLQILRGPVSRGCPGEVDQDSVRTSVSADPGPPGPAVGTYVQVLEYMFTAARDRQVHGPSAFSAAAAKDVIAFLELGIFFEAQPKPIKRSACDDHTSPHLGHLRQSTLPPPTHHLHEDHCMSLT